MAPYFFKILIPGFLTEFHIPISFLKHLGLQESTNGNEFSAVLKDPSWEGRVWPMRVGGDGRLFLDGWKKFADDHSLCVGDFLTFNHLGGYVFDVTVFDPVSASARSFSAEKTGHVKPKGKKSTPFTRRADFTSLIPVQFARKNDLMKRWCKMILIDQKDRRWPVYLTSRNAGRTQSYYFSGWDMFAAANGLKLGDTVIFELIHSGSRPIMKFYKES